MMTWYSHLIQTGSHIIGIYPNEKAKLDAAFEFLKDGLFRNESVMLITDSIPKAKIIKRMTNEWSVDVPRLVATNDIIVKDATEWYFEHGKPDPKKIKEQWNGLVNHLLNEGKSGLRVFEDTRSFFRRGFAKELVDYESTLEKKFNLPLTAVCAYEYEDIDTLSFKQFSVLKEHHGVVWM
jgi:DcmR-like sensory protein